MGPDPQTIRRGSLGGLAGAALAAALLATSALAAPPALAGARRLKVTVVQTSAGRVLAAGNTVYTLQPSQTPCSAQCLKVWPAVILPKGQTRASAGPGVAASRLGTVRTGAGLQVTYGGKRLYWYVGDQAPGQVTGNFSDQWGKWADVAVAGAGATGRSPGSGSGANAGGGVAY